MKKALIYYFHGLGDIIQLTPHLRYLYNDGYCVDLMCRKDAIYSHLLDDCPYTDKLIPIENPWLSPLGFDEQNKLNVQKFHELLPDYDWYGMCLHRQYLENKIMMNSAELGIDPPDKSLEVFIPKEIEKEAIEYINGQEYIFLHTGIENHPAHTWDARAWIKENLPNLPVIDTGFGGTHYKIHDNINFSFVLAREAKHRVLSSSVMVHACDAMNCVIDIIYYGKIDRKVWPLDQSKVLHIIEENKCLK
jgi:hypothetical protein